MAFSFNTPVNRSDDPPSKLSANEYLARITPLGPF